MFFSRAPVVKVKVDTLHSYCQPSTAMKLVWASLLCLFACTVSTAATSFRNIDASRLASLIRNNTVNSDQLLVVMFFAPWADGYKLFLPDWTSLVAELSSDTMLFASIDAVQHAQGGTYFIPSLPTVYTFSRGRPLMFDSTRLDRTSMSRILRRMHSPEILDWKSDSLPSSKSKYIDLIMPNKNDFASVVGLFSSSSSSSLQKAFVDAARAMKHRLQFFRCIDCTTVQNLLAVPSQDDVVIVYNRNSSDFIEFQFSEQSDNSTWLSIQLRSFIHQYSLPVLITNPHVFIDDLKDNQLPVLKLFSDASNQKRVVRERKYLEVLHQTMRDLRGKMVAVYYRNDSSRNITELQELGVTGLKLPVVFIHDVGRYRLKYLFDSSKSISTVNLRSFIYDFFVGKLTRYYRSQEPVSIDWASMFGSQSVQYQHEKMINYTVGLTFQRDVLNRSGSVVVLFCQPDVAACRHATELLQAVAAYLLPHNNALRFWLFDPITNDFPPDVGFVYPELIGGKGTAGRGAPALFAVLNATPVRYSADCASSTQKQIVSFLKKHLPIHRPPKTTKPRDEL